jgi:polar amino acid transport system permease protein
MKLKALSQGRSPPISNLKDSAYVEAFRGTPLLVQIFIIYFGVGGYLKSYGIDIDPFIAGVIALGLNSVAYQAEIFRSAV